MSISFQKVWENSQKSIGRDFWTGGNHQPAPELDDTAKQMVLRGLELRPEREDGKTFWDDFIEIMTQNSEAASKLLGVSSDTVARWPKSIREIVKKVREENDHEDDDKDMVQTGDDVANPSQSS